MGEGGAVRDDMVREDEGMIVERTLLKNKRPSE